jgi:hypothetical protein
MRQQPILREPVFKTAIAAGGRDGVADIENAGAT